MDTKIHVPTYDGKQKNFEKWREKFEAYCYTRGCGTCLIENGEINLPTAMIGKFSTDKDIEKLEKKIGKSKYQGNGPTDNDLNYAYL